MHLFYHQPSALRGLGAAVAHIQQKRKVLGQSAECVNQVPRFVLMQLVQVKQKVI